MALLRSCASAAIALGAALLCAAAAFLAGRGVGDPWLAAALVGAVALVPAGVTAIALDLAHRRGAERRARGTRLAELLGASTSESQSRALLLDHAARLAGGGAVMLTHVDSTQRLEPEFGARVADTPLRALLVGHPRAEACLALRLGRTETRGPSPSSTAAGCELCGRLAGESVCEPLLIADRMLGSLLVASVDPIRHSAREQLHEAATRAAPLLALQRTVAAADRHAARDPLTGLPNRRAAGETLARLCAQAGRTLTPLAAVLVDLDRFAALNDRYGHERADATLAGVGRALAAGVRGSDFVARYGGQAFLVLAPDTGRAGAAALAEKLRRDVQELTPAGSGQVTASFGVAALPEDAADGDGLVRGAERALGMAKALGRNRVATPQPDATPGG